MFQGAFLVVLMWIIITSSACDNFSMAVLAETA
jgi:hypothetical protein